MSEINPFHSTKEIGTEERAKLAVKAFTRLQPSLTAYARILTKNPDVRVVLSSTDAGRTDGTRIFYRPPITLADTIPHQRSLCDKRDADIQLRCPACAQREEVLATIYHEIAHIVFDSFQAPRDEDLQQAIKGAVSRYGGHYGNELQKRFDAIPFPQRGSFITLARTVSPYMQLIINAVEDARVNNSLFSTREGLRVMFDARVRKLIAEGVEQIDPETRARITIKWPDYPLNTQAILACLLVAQGHAFEGAFAPQIEALMLDNELRTHLRSVATARSVAASYEISFNILARLRELGYCISEDDPKPEPQPEPDPEPEPEQEQEDEPEQDKPETPPEDESSDNAAFDSTTGTGEPGDDAEFEADGEDEAAEAPSGSEGGMDSDDDASHPDDGAPDLGDDGSDDGNGDSRDRPAEDEQADRGEPESGDRDGSEVGDEEPAEGSEGGDDRSDEVDADGGDPAGADGGNDETVADPAGAEAGGADVPRDAEPDSDGDDAAGSAGDDDRTDPGEGPPSPAGTPQQEDLTGDEPPADADSVREDGDAGDGEGDLPDDSQTSEEGEEGEPEVVESGADEGYGGVEVIEAEENSDVPYGDASDVEEVLYKWEDHDRPDSIHEETAKEDKEMAKAIVTGLYFESPSRYVTGVDEHYFTNDRRTHELDDSDFYSPPGAAFRKWNACTKSRRIELGIEAQFGLTPSEALIGPALLRMRVAFADNQRADKERHRKSGRVNGRVLGRRAPLDDTRLFMKRSVPGKRDYFVVIGMDVSASTAGTNLLLEKKAVAAQAALLQRLGISFSIIAHSSSMTDQKAGRVAGVSMQVYHIKDADEVWNDRTQIRLERLGFEAGNLDGHSMEYYRKMLDRRTETDRIIMYYTDGKMPAENHDEELQILQREIKICKRKGYTLMGVGINTDSPIKHGLDTVEVTSEADVAKVVKHLGKRLAAAR